MHVINLTDEAQRFIDEWNNEVPFVTAQTSGSTGYPKEIRLLKADMACSAYATNSRFGISPASRLLCPLSSDYIAGKMMIVRALLAGCELILEKPSNSPLAENYGDIDLMAVVPSQCQALLNNPTASRTLKNLIVGGAAINASLEHHLLNMPWRTFATYGMTETCSHVALRKIGSDVYEAMPGISFSIDPTQRLIINAPEYSFKKLITNDMADLLSDSSFRWLGRFDNVINSGGIKFHPEQLEKMLEGRIDFPFFFRGVPDEKWGEAIEMVIECAEGHSEAAVREGMNACVRHLPHRAIPKRIILTENLPRTNNGKLKRRP